MSTENYRLVGVLSAGDTLFAVIDDTEGVLFAVLAENTAEEEP